MKDAQTKEQSDLTRKQSQDESDRTSDRTAAREAQPNRDGRTPAKGDGPADGKTK